MCVFGLIIEDQGHFDLTLRMPQLIATRSLPVPDTEAPLRSCCIIYTIKAINKFNKSRGTYRSP